MTKLVSSLHFALAGDGVPDWVHLVPAGRFSGVDGRGPFTLGDAACVIAASMADGSLPIDENHATDLAAPKGEPSPARGWITEMESRADGVWGRVEWTDSGRAMMADKQYRGISPVFTHEKDGRVVKILRAALTNTPNLRQLATPTPQDTTMDLAHLPILLGLAADADEAAVLAAIEQGAAQRTALQSQVTSLQTQLTNVQAAAVKQELVIELQAQIADLTARAARDRATAFVDGAIKAGKPIVPLREHFIARHMAEPAAVEKEIGALPSLHAGGVAPGQTVVRHAADDGDGLTDTDLFVARKMGLDRKKMAEHKKKLAAEKAEAA